MLPLLGPAFVACIAYVDPGNFATNISGGAQYGYLLLWVILAANLVAMLVQNLTAKIGIATGKNLPQLCREHLGRRASFGLWIQAELVAMATDLAEFVGAAIALNLLFGVPLFASGLITAAMAFVILAAQSKGYRRFETVILGFLGIILLGFLYDTLKIGFDAGEAAKGFAPHFDGSDSTYPFGSHVALRPALSKCARLSRHILPMPMPWAARRLRVTLCLCTRSLIDLSHGWTATTSSERVYRWAGSENAVFSTSNLWSWQITSRSVLQRAALSMQNLPFLKV